MKPIKLYTDLSVHLYEGEAAKKRGAPTPITYLTQWQMMGNSQVQQYLTQWKVEGNSVVDNNAILSCGDLGQDGKYHVKISNGVTIYDIPLTEPLRKVNDVADTIEFADGVATITRNLKEVGMATLDWRRYNTGVSDIYRYIALVEDAYSYAATELIKTINTGGYKNVRGNDTYYHQAEEQIIGMYEVSASFTYPAFAIYDPNYNQANDLSSLLTYLSDKRMVYRLATPTTEVIQVSPFPISPTDTYTSANDTPYSAFEHTENKEIWSCGEYNATDGKYHILVQPLGGSIADIALDEPLRKVNNVADSIEFADGVATLTRNLASVDLGDCLWTAAKISGSSDIYRVTTYSVHDTLKVVSSESTVANILTAIYNTIPVQKVNNQYTGIAVNTVGYVIVFDGNYNQSDSAAAFKLAMDGVELIYELANPTTETIQAPQIEEADSYSCVISQGAKAVSWSSFETE